MGIDVSALYWYEEVDSTADLVQGDIIEYGITFEPESSFWEEVLTCIKDPSRPRDAVRLTGRWSVRKSVLITQTCDLEKHKARMSKKESYNPPVLLCPITSMEEWLPKVGERQEDAWKDLLDKASKLIDGRKLSLLGLPSYISYGVSLPLSVVHLSVVHSIPLKSVLALSKESGKRIRLQPPYREKLSQAFGYTFMRVGTIDSQIRQQLEDYRNLVKKLRDENPVG